MNSGMDHRCEQAYGARLDEHKADQQQLQGQFDELQTQLLCTREELEDLRASASQDKNLVVAEESERYMGQKEFEAYFSTLTPVEQEAVRKEYDVNFDFELDQPMCFRQCSPFKIPNNSSELFLCTPQKNPT